MNGLQWTVKSWGYSHDENRFERSFNLCVEWVRRRSWKKFNTHSSDNPWWSITFTSFSNATVYVIEQISPQEMFSSQFFIKLFFLSLYFFLSPLFHISQAFFRLSVFYFLMCEEKTEKNVNWNFLFVLCLAILCTVQLELHRGKRQLSKLQEQRKKKLMN